MITESHQKQLDKSHTEDMYSLTLGDFTHYNAHQPILPPPIPAKAGPTIFTTLVGGLYHLHVGRGVVSLDVGVDSLLDQALLQLSLGQLAPHSWLVAALGKLIGSIQIPNVLNENLARRDNIIP